MHKHENIAVTYEHDFLNERIDIEKDIPQGNKGIKYYGCVL